MNMKTNRNYQMLASFVLFVSFAFFYACKKEPLVYETSSQVNITGYLDNHPDQFSEFRKILEVTGTASFLQAYGKYTIFLPDNDGVAAYLKSVGKTSVEQVDVQELKNLVRFHLLEDTVATGKFTDGKLPVLTMFGQYLVTGANNSGGQTRITVNRQANIIQGNIRVGNGLIHVIDHMLVPEKLTLAQMIEANPDYSIFSKALRETKLYDSLDVLPAAQPDSAKRFLTMLVESDQVLASAGFPSYEALKAEYSNSADLSSSSNGLHAYLAYHILFGAKYIADLVSAQAHQTMARPEIITAKLQNQQVLLNDMIFNKVYEPGFTLARAASDRSAANGVLHVTAPYTPAGSAPTTGHFVIKQRFPFPVYWDVADFPEVRRNPLFRRSGGGEIVFSKTSATAPSPIDGWWWPKTGAGIGYRNDGAGWVNNDYLNLVLGVSSRNDYIDMKTPLIVKGTYKVWVCYRRQNQSGRWPTRIGTKARVIIDGEVLPTPFFFAEPPPGGSSSELEALGWKYYTSNGNAAAPFLKQTYQANGETSNSPWVAKMVGIVNIKSTDVHSLRLEALQDSQNANNLDMIQFIPIDYVSQILPRFKPDGTEDWTDYPGTH